MFFLLIPYRTIPSTLLGSESDLSRRRTSPSPVGENFVFLRRSIKLLQQPGHVLTKYSHGSDAFLVAFDVALLSPYAHVPVDRPGDDHLVDEEIKHKKTFEDMLSEIKKDEPFESYPGEYLAYLRDYVDRIIFADEVLDRKISKVRDTSSAIDFGIQRELESILYYQEIRKFVPESQHNLVDRILDEERKHFSELSELRKKYAGTQ